MDGASYKYFAIVVPASIILPVLPAILKYKVLSRELKIISWYLIFAAFASVFTSTLAYYRINNMPAMHVYTLIEFVLLVHFYKVTLNKMGTSKWLALLTPSFFLLCIVNVLFFQGIYIYNTYTKSIEALLVILLAVIYFKRKLDNMENEVGHRSSIFLVNTGLLLYFAGSFVFFIIPNMVLKDMVISRLIWCTHATFLLVMYLLFAVALWKYKK